VLRTPRPPGDAPPVLVPSGERRGLRAGSGPEALDGDPGPAEADEGGDGLGKMAWEGVL